ncbi:MAG: hypothetical protein VYE22_39085 [Myxococcota bacterium]|nr:hypothetical protein [Myxococcota bacterium]
MRRAVPFLLMLCVAAPAAADIVVDRPIVRPLPRATLAAVVATGSAPAADVAETERQTRRALARRLRAVQRCLAETEPFRDPNRRGARWVEARLTFERDARPRVDQVRSGGVDESARRCVLEAAQGIQIRRAPRGTVHVRVRFRL